MSVTDYALSRKLAAEFAGTAFLLAAIVGSGIQASLLADGNAGLALLCSAVATGAVLVVLITLLAPVSGAHFNPAVTLGFLARREITLALAGLYVLSQITGGAAGTLVAHAMFTEPAWQVASQGRTGVGQWLSEGIAAFGLVAAILVAVRQRAEAVPWVVGLYIMAAHWFTASTSFANPAVTLARTVTDTVAGIRPGDAPAFVLAQLAGALLAAAAVGWLIRGTATSHSSRSRSPQDA